MNDLLKKYIKKENNLFQTTIWESFQQSQDRDTFWISSDDGEVLVIKLPLINKYYYLYCPRAPQTTEDGWRLFLNRLREIAKNENCIFVRVEPMKVPNGILKDLNFREVRKYSPMSVQYSPMNTLLLDIEKDEESLLQEMKSKWRYNIKLAAKKGVTVRVSENENDLEKFYELSKGMESRGYHSHSFEHYKSLFAVLKKNNAGCLFVAEHEGEIISAIIVSIYNEVAIYLHGASSDSKRDLMPNHLVQWAAIREAKKQGCKIYDFWGVAPEGSTEAHSWDGITRFKLGFGGERVRFLGAFDYTFSSFWYIILCSANYVRKVFKR